MSAGICARGIMKKTLKLYCAVPYPAFYPAVFVQKMFSFSWKKALSRNCYFKVSKKTT